VSFCGLRVREIFRGINLDPYPFHGAILSLKGIAIHGQKRAQMLYLDTCLQATSLITCFCYYTHLTREMVGYHSIPIQLVPLSTFIIRF
jgi:hypothetical protein